MPKKISISDLIKNYDEISEACHSSQEFIFVTKNGKSDLVIMSIEVYEQIMGELELYSKIDKGKDDIENGRVKPARDVFVRKQNIIKTADEIIDRNIEAFKELEK